MGTIVSLTSTTGILPLDIWICDSCDSTATCVYYDTTSSLPYSFTLPSEYENNIIYAIRVIDDTGCIYCNSVSALTLQYQDGGYAEFQDGDEFDFQ
jgi:hypothetical protein